MALGCETEKGGKDVVYYAFRPILKEEDVERAAACLPAELAAHCLENRSPARRVQSVSAWTALAALVDRTFQKKLDVRFAENGKPTAQDLFISLAHTDGAVAVCVGTVPCGIDIEPSRPKENAEALLRRFFPEELPSAGSPSDRFFFAFTAREAKGKMNGEGFFGKENAALVVTEKVALCGEEYIFSLAAKSRCTLKKVRLSQKNTANFSPKNKTDQEEKNEEI